MSNVMDNAGTEFRQIDEDGKWMRDAIGMIFAADDRIRRQAQTIRMQQDQIDLLEDENDELVKELVSMLGVLCDDDDSEEDEDEDENETEDKSEQSGDTGKEMKSEKPAE